MSHENNNPPKRRGKKGLSNEEIDWLKQAVEDKKPYPEIAIHLSVCVDTAKRMAVRYGFAVLDGAKYQISTKQMVAYWERPCMRCGCTKKRPKWQFFCYPCTEQNQKDSEGLNDSWL